MIIEVITFIFVIFFQGDEDQPNEGESDHLLRGSGSASFADAGRGSDVQVEEKFERNFRVNGEMREKIL
jgi:hypothetical protein